MQAQNFVQLELPIIPQQTDSLKQIEKAIQDMLDVTWKGAIAHIPRPTTKQLMQQHGKLIALSDSEAWIRVPSMPIFRLYQHKLPDIKAGFKRAFGTNIKINLVVGKTLN